VTRGLSVAPGSDPVTLKSRKENRRLSSNNDAVDAGRHERNPRTSINEDLLCYTVMLLLLARFPHQFSRDDDNHIHIDYRSISISAQAL